MVMVVSNGGIKQSTKQLAIINVSRLNRLNTKEEVKMENGLSALIDNFLHEHRLTQTWLADKAGVSSSYINSLVRGHGTLSVRMAHSIGAAFDSVKLVRKPWGEHLLRMHLTDIACEKLAELAEYTKQQEQDK